MEQIGLAADIPVLWSPSTGSTSREARSGLATGHLPRLPCLLQTGRQEGGVGRFGRPWESPEGGLWMTLVWPLPTPPGPVVDGLGLRLGLAFRRAICRACSGHKEVRLKWPNDILLGSRKVAGILTEIVAAADRSVALVGVGVNANFPASRLPEHLRHTATTLREALGRDVDLQSLRDDLVREASNALRESGLSEVHLAEANAVLAGVGASARVRTANDAVEGTLRRLDHRGRIVLLTDQGEWTAPEGAELLGGQE